MSEIATRLDLVRAKIAAAAERSGRAVGAVRLVLVTKTVEAGRVRDAIAAGIRDLGENKVQEGKAKAIALADENLRWSMIGHLQSNKIKDALEFASEIQSLDRLSVATQIEKHLQKLGHRLDVMVQVNTSGEESKYGLAPDELMAFLKQLKAFDCLRLKGLMTLATFTTDETEVRRCFRLLRSLRDRTADMLPDGTAAELSMGMSGDFEAAIEEGATTVRVGQAVFGSRPLPDSHYWPGAPGIGC